MQGDGDRCHDAQLRAVPAAESAVCSPAGVGTCAEKNTAGTFQEAEELSCVLVYLEVGGCCFLISLTGVMKSPGVREPDKGDRLSSAGTVL